MNFLKEIFNDQQHSHEILCVNFIMIGGFKFYHDMVAAFRVGPD